MLARATLAEEDASRAEWFELRDKRHAKKAKEDADREQRRQEFMSVAKAHEEKMKQDQENRRA